MYVGSLKALIIVLTLMALMLIEDSPQSSDSWYRPTLSASENPSLIIHLFE